MKRHTDQAIILKRINYGERDRILTLLCRDLGKVSVLAKGVRAEKSKLAGGIELLSETDVSMIEGRSDLMTLTSSRLRRHFGSIINAPQRLEQMFRYLSLLEKLIDERAGQEYYAVLLKAHEALDDAGFDEKVVDIWLHMRVLQLHGSSPNLNAKAGASFGFDYDRQQFVLDPDGLFGQNDIKLLRLCQKSTKPPHLELRPSSIDQLQGLLYSMVGQNVTNV